MPEWQVSLQRLIYKTNSYYRFRCTEVLSAKWYHHHATAVRNNTSVKLLNNCTEDWTNTRNKQLAVNTRLNHLQHPLGRGHRSSLINDTLIGVYAYGIWYDMNYYFVCDYWIWQVIMLDYWVWNLKGTHQSQFTPHEESACEITDLVSSETLRGAPCSLRKPPWQRVALHTGSTEFERCGRFTRHRGSDDLHLCQKLRVRLFRPLLIWFPTLVIPPALWKYSPDSLLYLFKLSGISLAGGEADEHTDKCTSFCQQRFMQIRNKSSAVILIHMSSSLYRCGGHEAVFHQGEWAALCSFVFDFLY